MRVVRIRVADAGDDGHLLVVPERLERGHAGVEPEAIVDLQDVLFGDPDGLAIVVVQGIAVGDHRVQGVITAR